MKRKWIVVGVVLIAILVAASISYIYLLFSEKAEKTEQINGKYNAVIRYFENYAMIEYTDETGKHLGYFKVEMKNALDWIKINTAEGSVFLCWWGDGHMIKGYAEREVIIRNPSKETLEMAARPHEIKEFDSQERVVDVAIAFSATDPDETRQIMQKYGASYIFLSTGDLKRGEAHWMFKIAGLDASQYYYDFQQLYPDYSEKAKETVVIRLLENRDVEGFTLIFEDAMVKIYKIG